MLTQPSPGRSSQDEANQRIAKEGIEELNVYHQFAERLFHDLLMHASDPPPTRRVGSLTGGGR